MIELNIIKLYENLAKLNEAKSDIDNFIDKFGEETYDLFKRSIQRLKNKGVSTDLTYHVKYTDKKDLEALLINLQNRAITKDGNLTEIDGDYEYIGEGKGYKVYKINDAVASINLGSGTGWCISGRYGHYGEKNYTPSRDVAEEHWRAYKNKGVTFYFFIGNKDKVALAVYPYPKTFDFNEIIDGAYVKRINFEVYDERDNKNSALIPNLPLNLIKSDIILEEQPLENGLYIQENILVRCDKSLKDVVIPNSVTRIGNSAFRNCSSLTSIEIPDSVTNIDYSAFSGCKNLTNITIPDSVTSIDYGTFQGCSSLTNITIPDIVTSIGDWAFAYCTQLKNITIPDSVTSIGKWAFEGCPNLKNIEVSDDNPNYKVVNGHLYNKNGKMIV